MKKAITCILIICLFLFTPTVNAANYGEGDYGLGNYNEGDVSSPSGGSVSYFDGFQNTTTVSITVGDGSDTSGINTASRILQRHSATLTNGNCGNYPDYAPISPSGSYPNFTDSTVESGNCYQYRYLVSDNGSNQATYTSTNTVKIDTSLPNTPGIPSTTSPTNSSTQTWTWTAATDAISNIVNYLWRTTGSIVTSGSTTVNNLATSFGEGVYNLFIKAVDQAGNQSSESSPGIVTIDQTGPQITGISSSSPTSTGTTITWTTNEDASSKVEYGQNTNYGSTTPETDTTSKVTNHSVVLIGLSACTEYHYRVSSTDNSSNGSISNDNTFTTAGCLEPTPTSTLTPSFTPSPSPTTALATNTPSNNSDPSPQHSPPVCTDQPPGTKTPWLYSASPVDSTNILLQFTAADLPVSKYILEYGTKSGEYKYGTQDMNTNSRDSMSYLVRSLSPNTTYYFRIKSQNGCATGQWSNEISTRTNGLITTNNLKLTDTTIAQAALESPTPSESSCQSYTVKAGDSLWTIARSVLGDSNKYEQIINENKSTYKSLSTSQKLKIGWILKVNCHNSPPQSEQSTPTTTKPKDSYSIQVKVLDNKKQPVVGAKVTIHSDPMEAVTDQNGIANFSQVKPGNHKLFIAYKDYNGEQAINLSGNTEKIELTVNVQKQPISISPTLYWLAATASLLIFLLVVIYKKFA